MYKSYSFLSSTVRRSSNSGHVRRALIMEERANFQRYKIIKITNMHINYQRIFFVRFLFSLEQIKFGIVRLLLHKYLPTIKMYNGQYQ